MMESGKNNQFRADRHGHHARLGRLVQCVGIFIILLAACAGSAFGADPPRERTSLNEDWRFMKGDPAESAKVMVYDVWTGWPQQLQGKEAEVLKGWILPSGNGFIKDAAKRYTRPEGKPGEGIAYLKAEYDDGGWQRINLPHDWAIAGPFTSSGGGGMGRLPTTGVGWYRKKLDIPAQDAGKRIFLDVDGAMSYSSVWVNGELVGGWPFGYASYRLGLTPYLKAGGANELVIRLENPPDSSRWYPGAGLYRNVWLVKTASIHVGQWGTFLTTPEVSPASATVNLKATIDNSSPKDANVTVYTDIFLLDPNGNRTGGAVASMKPVNLKITANGSAVAESTAKIARPKRWGPPPQQRPNRYVAVSTVRQGKNMLDRYETSFGIRTLKLDPNVGLLVNGQHIPLQGANQHHDLGALGAALNERALQRQLETLREMGCNAIRTSHNPPAPELLDLADKMGFLIMDEAFDVWLTAKVRFDYHLVYPDWHEQDLRAFIRRDRNHPSVFLWSVGNEVPENYSTMQADADRLKELIEIAHQEDPTRLVTSPMNNAKPTSPFPVPMDVISLNYQGEGIRGTPSQYQPFHDKFPDKMIVSAETGSALSSRGEFIFPVTPNNWAAVGPTSGEDLKRRQVSAYELYSMSYGASADKVFATLAKYPYVSGEFIWTGWDYLGEPSPFDQARSAYYGSIDLAGFKKERFYLYQAHWRPDLPMAHILPHWTWPERVGQVTPVHVFTSGDEAELFLNGKSLGRKKKGEFEYRLRWDEVVYAPGTLSVVAYKQGKKWAPAEMKTAGDAAKLKLEPDRSAIAADGLDLSFVTVTVTDAAGLTAPRADNRIHFAIEGPGEIVATDNGDPTSFEPFPSPDRKAFNGLCLVIVLGKAGQPGTITLSATADGLESGKASIKTVRGR